VSVALVTGGGGEGCGRAIARRLAREGAFVIVCDIDERAGWMTVKAIEAEGGSAASRAVNVRSREQISEAYAFARTIGPLTTVVNNASAIDAFHPDQPLEYWDELVETDFLGTLWSTRIGIDALRASGGGAIVNVSSTSALPRWKQSGSPVYDIAKLAVLRLSMRLAFLQNENIRVNCIVPHWIAVPFLVDYVATLSPEERSSQGVPERLIPIEEVVDAVYRLATDVTLAGEAIVWPDGGEPRLLRAGD
jgi:NAD(P)-dependent dehydrogenase (short-subunit alcohol dehydrogenase family)